MRFTLSSVLLALAVVSSAAASPTDKEATKRSTATSGGECNGTSCRVGFDNIKCNKGSCAGSQGGDGSRCTVVDYDNGSRTAFCPGCGNDDLC
ncbi:hypothetical protein F4781DRAFT_431793 [Annulohypoxylon bovei var. microspora]|nr:hypothetical protein F4781DRAFT_431793 [Annulohypoxylon bovei var. microspora]